MLKVLQNWIMGPFDKEKYIFLSENNDQCQETFFCFGTDCNKRDNHIVRCHVSMKSQESQLSDGILRVYPGAHWWAIWISRLKNLQRVCLSQQRCTLYDHLFIYLITSQMTSEPIEMFRINSALNATHKIWIMTQFRSLNVFVNLQKACLLLSWQLTAWCVYLHTDWVAELVTLFGMHFNARCEHKYLELPTWDWINQNTCYHEMWTVPRCRLWEELNLSFLKTMNM